MPLASGVRDGRLFKPRRRQFALLQGGVDLGHGGRAIGLALAVEPLLMGAETGDPRSDLGLEIFSQVRTGKGKRPRYLPCRFPEHFYGWLYCRPLSYRWRLGCR